ncbi:MAG TPA: Ig-like domain-containing protein, partial [Anaerolineaceae bacterium]|nr:Ig-like domain-containing protein [Anaerolineaceae bacterium]
TVPDITDPVTLFNQLTTGDSTNCGQTSDGSLACWGYNYSCLNQDSRSPECLVLSGPASPPEGIFRQVSCGYRHTCGVQSNGLVDCWGAKERGQSDPPDRLFAQVAGGEEYACGIQSDGALSCWGTPLGNIQPPRIKLLPENLPPYHQDLPYTAQLTASTGTPPYHFSLLSGNLPPGITLSPSGQISGTTEAQGDYTFTVEVQDSSFPISSQVTYQMWINTRPTAAAQITTAIEDTNLDIQLTASDLENDPLSWSVNAPAHGTLAGTAPNLVYTPELNFNGPDSFTFTVNDGYIDSEPATVTITVTPVNDAPLAVDDVFTGLEDAVLIIASPGVLGNDLDNDGDRLHAALLTQPLHGELTLLADGSFSYTPEPDYYGSDTFTYLMMATPGLLLSDWSDEALVTLTINPINDVPVPTPLDDAAWLAREAHAAAIPEFFDIDSEDLLYSAQLEDGTPLPGFLSFDSESRTFSGMPANSDAGSYRIRVTASDGELTTTASFTLTIQPSEYLIHLPLMLR